MDLAGIGMGVRSPGLPLSEWPLNLESKVEAQAIPKGFPTRGHAHRDPHFAPCYILRLESCNQLANSPGNEQGV